MLRAGAQAPRHADPPLAGAAEKPSCGCAFTVIARWHENLDWTWKLRMPFVVMDKAAGNVGRESLSYLHFIVENYANRFLKMAEKHFGVRLLHAGDHLGIAIWVRVLREHSTLTVAATRPCRAPLSHRTTV